MKASVIICAYTEKRWDDLVAAVQSIQAQSLPPSEIIVVIDHNRPLFAQACTHFPTVLVVENQEQRGLSGARNTGVAQAQGDILAFMDEDALAEPDWLAQLVNCYRDPQVMGVGGAIVPLWQKERPAWFPAEFDWVVGCTYLGMPARVAPVRNLIGCNMSFRRQIFQTIGGFRSGIGRVGTVPVGCEETELCIRAQQRWPEQKILYEPQARVRHRVPAARANWRYFQARCYGEGQSKALISQWVGATAALSTERAYTLRTLPTGIGRGLADTLFGHRPAGLARAGAIIAGFGITGMGYLTKRITRLVLATP